MLGCGIAGGTLPVGITLFARPLATCVGCPLCMDRLPGPLGGQVVLCTILALPKDRGRIPIPCPARFRNDDNSYARVASDGIPRPMWMLGHV